MTHQTTTMMIMIIIIIMMMMMITMMTRMLTASLYKTSSIHSYIQQGISAPNTPTVTNISPRVSLSRHGKIHH